MARRVFGIVRSLNVGLDSSKDRLMSTLTFLIQHPNDTLTLIELLIELAEEGIGYTDPYFREKWRMDEKLAEIKRNLEISLD